MILAWTDQDGDQVAVESAYIIGISVRTVTGPHKPDETVTVTLVWTLGTGDRPFMVAQPFAEVFEAWMKARDSGGSPGRPGYHGWPMQYTHISSLLPGTPAWAPEAKGPR